MVGFGISLPFDLAQGRFQKFTDLAAISAFVFKNGHKILLKSGFRL
jgi:hypothetical protein